MRCEFERHYGAWRIKSFDGTSEELQRLIAALSSAMQSRAGLTSAVKYLFPHAEVRFEGNGA